MTNECRHKFKRNQRSFSESRPYQQHTLLRKYCTSPWLDHTHPYRAEDHNSRAEHSIQNPLPSLLTLFGMTIGDGSRPSASLGLSVMMVSCAPLALTSSPHVRICGIARVRQDHVIPPFIVFAAARGMYAFIAVQYDPSGDRFMGLLEVRVGQSIRAKSVGRDLKNGYCNARAGYTGIRSVWHILWRRPIRHYLSINTHNEVWMCGSHTGRRQGIPIDGCTAVQPKKKAQEMHVRRLNQRLRHRATFLEQWCGGKKLKLPQLSREARGPEGLHGERHFFCVTYSPSVVPRTQPHLEQYFH